MGRVIGIDLGTTNSCVAMVDQGKPIVIPNTGGYKTTPSMFAISPDGKRLVGHLSKRQAITNNATATTEINTLTLRDAHPTGVKRDLNQRNLKHKGR